MKKYAKISILGDFMCEPPLLYSVKKRDGSYDFKPVFRPLKKLLREADYVIANLETPVAGADLSYTSELVSFNAPDTFLHALKEIGVDLVSTANNHALDRGIEGLKRTIDALDACGIAHTGTYKTPEEEKNMYFTVGDTRVALLATTYGTNEIINGVRLSEKDRPMVNYHIAKRGDRPVVSNVPNPPVFSRTLAFVESLTKKPLSWEEKIGLKRALGISTAYADDAFYPDLQEEGARPVREMIREAKEKADLVLLLPHSGGQFNTVPGKRSEHLMDLLVSFGADCVLMSHSHTTQRARLRGRVPCFFSLGNVSMMPDTVYPEMETLPEYGLVAHLYVSGGKIRKTGFSVFKICLNRKNQMRVIPADELYESLASEEERAKIRKEVAKIVSRVSDKPVQARKPKREYSLFT